MTRHEAETLGWTFLSERDVGPAPPGSGHRWLEGLWIAERRFPGGPLIREQRGTAHDLLEAIEARQLAHG